MQPALRAVTKVMILRLRHSITCQSYQIERRFYFFDVGRYKSAEPTKMSQIIASTK